MATVLFWLMIALVAVAAVWGVKMIGPKLGGPFSTLAAEV